MKNKLFSISLIFILLFMFISCGQVIDDNPPDIDISDDENKDPNEDEDDKKQDEPVDEKTEFCVSLIYNKKIYIPTNGEKITVIWADDYSQYSAVIDSNGYAKIKLDGSYNVYLESAPENYSYNPNIYNADNENSTVEIELVKVGKISKGSGTALYKEYEITTTGTYRTILTSKSHKVYYEYAPKKSGTYIVESHVNINEDIINPKLDVWNGSFAAKFFDKTYNDGGASKSGGYTKNFKWKLSLADEQIGSVFTFVVFAESKIDLYPLTIDFTIEYYDKYELDHPDVKLMVAKECELARVPDKYSTSTHKYINSDGGTGSYYSGLTNGTGLLNGNNFKYNEETKLWHVYDSVTNTFGPALCAKITAPCAYYDQGLNIIEYNGNNDLTVSDGTENYKLFIENEYAAVCNSDGVCYVTMELKEFLQKFSLSQRLFFDGYGFVEMADVYAKEEDQWLFACGYYVEK